MARRLNKKILVFIDESGTAGDPDFMLGAVVVASRHAGMVGSAFIGLRNGSGGEAHAAEMKGETCRRLLRETRGALSDVPVVTLNVSASHHTGGRDEIYARGIVEAVKVATLRYGRITGLQSVGNVELILDRNGINETDAFRARMVSAQKTEGRFRGVSHIAALDSAAAPLLQMADLVAYARRWRDAGEIDARRLDLECGVSLL
ncbi:DUF3800 domain-containing protein [Jannaschia sp. 2305UL9-9]|uniref:DUF3800 domain-containing protein n=1 Tax=Jannaschia sp. 2305UL9-9 TaxID=3121638 RepID=UPI003526E9FF